MKYLSNRNGFLGVDNKFNFKEKVVVVPFGLEKTVSYGGGTRNGPKEIIKASHQVELYDEELNCEPYKKIGIKTLKPFKIHRNIKKALEKMSNINKEILDKRLFPITFGGEHSITPGCIYPFVKKYKKICLLHFDAHADLRNSYNGEKFSHASAIRRCLDHKNISLISFGIRNISESEIPFLKKNKSRINILKNFIQDTVICAELLGKEVDMHKYAVQITVADSRDGACSSSTLKEASSWGKVDVTKEQMVFAEATSVLPLIASDAYHRGEWKNRDKKKFTKIFE